jgi:hypothetical protein
MHLKVFDKLSRGNLIDKRKKDKIGAPAEPDQELKENEAEMHDTGEAITLPSDVIPIRPHGPVAELTLDEEEQQNTAGITLDEVEINDSTKLGEDIKIAEVTAVKAMAAPPGAQATVTPNIPAAVTTTAPVTEKKPDSQEAKKEEKTQDADSLKNLFNTEEEEENPLASLINSLPDVSVREIMDDLAEIQRIIKEWRPSRK